MQRIKQNRQREAVTSGDKTNKVESRPNSERQKVIVRADKRSLSERTKGLCSNGQKVFVKKTLFPPYFKNKTTLVAQRGGAYINLITLLR
jgi:hypothetical protein